MKSSWTIYGICLFFCGTDMIKADAVYLPPPSFAGKPIAIIWIPGMRCKAEAYRSIAEEFQQVAAGQGYKAWIGVPSFLFDVPEPFLLGHYVESTFNVLKSKYSFPGSQIYLAAHSLGGVMTQIYAKGKSNFIKGQILMGAVLLRNTRKITDTGTTLFDYDIPTLTLNGELDGLMRISRGAEAYWHAHVNVDKSQIGKFPVIAMEGMSHSSFMDSKMLPSAVRSSDINPEVDEKTGYNMASKAMLSFIKSIQGDRNAWLSSRDFIAYTKAFMQPLLEAMELEGSYNLKPPCYDKTLVNERSPKCLQGSKWSEHAQKIMAGNISRFNAEIATQDNFHRVYTITPVHLPQINNTCLPFSDGNVTCMLYSITVTENIYNSLNQLDTGKFELGASEMKAKLMSRQSVQVAAGNKQADFHETDEVGNRCSEINQNALNWALAKANQKALVRYNKYGKKLVIGEDLGPYNAGPLWIWHYMQYSDNANKTQTTIRAPMMRTPMDYAIKSAAGFHYCKLLSPFRALEWLYIDSQYDHNGIKIIEEKEAKTWGFQDREKFEMMNVTENQDLLDFTCSGTPIKIGITTGYKINYFTKMAVNALAGIMNILFRYIFDTVSILSVNLLAADQNLAKCEPFLYVGEITDNSVVCFKDYIVLTEHFRLSGL